MAAFPLDVHISGKWQMRLGWIAGAIYYRYRSERKTKQEKKKARGNINEFAEITAPCRLDIVAKNPLIIKPMLIFPWAVILLEEHQSLSH